MALNYIVQKMKGSNKWYACRPETKNVAEYGYGTKKKALHDAAALMGISYDEYMTLYRKENL